MKDSIPAEGVPSAEIVEKQLKRILYLKKFIHNVPTDRPVKITVQYQVDHLNPCTETYVVIVQNLTSFKETRGYFHRVECRLLASGGRYHYSPYPVGSGYYLGINANHIISWEIISDDKAPLYMKITTPIIEGGLS